MTPSTKTYVSLYISKDIRDRAKALADSRRRSFSEYVVTLIERDIREAEKRKLETADSAQPTAA